MKADKLYKKSPRLERDDSGKMGIKKPTEATSEDMGTSGNPLPGGGGEMPVEVQQSMEQMHKRHSTEMKDMHERHEAEHGDMNKRHSKEVKKLAGTPAEKES